MSRTAFGASSRVVALKTERSLFSVLWNLIGRFSISLVSLVSLLTCCHGSLMVCFQVCELVDHLSRHRNHWPNRLEFVCFGLRHSVVTIGLFAVAERSYPSGFHWDEACVIRPNPLPVDRSPSHLSSICCHLMLLLACSWLSSLDFSFSWF